MVLKAFDECLQEAIDGTGNMNCQLCKYRKKIIGFEEEQGKEQIGHHLNVKGILFDEENRSFIENNNKWALKDMSERMLETIQRGMW